MESSRALARLSHENVVRVYDLGEIKGRPFFVMEHLTGQLLSRCIGQGSVLHQHWFARSALLQAKAGRMSFDSRNCM